MIDKSEPDTLQILSNHGINPFAAQLLVESYLRHQKTTRVSFLLSGVRVTLEMDQDEPGDLEDRP